MTSKINAVIVGASGYTGAECYRLLLNHPHVNNIEIIANSNAGQDITTLYNHFYDNPKILKKMDDVDFNAFDVAFFCLPHGQSQKIIVDIYNRYKNLKIIDLSADFRFTDTLLYEKIYATEHIAKNIQNTDVCYGLAEIVSEEKIKSSRIIACPGCYPTSAILPLLPLINAKMIDASDRIIIDSKSGLSGAGRKESAQYLMSERSDNTMAYNIFNHRHRYEIAEKLAINSSKILFTPHLVPQIRGIESTIYAKLTAGQNITKITQCLSDFYKSQPFVKIVNFIPSTAIVKGTNNVLIYAKIEDDNLIISSVVDNICKGSSGGAVQCMNISFGFNATDGLNYLQSYV